MNKGDQIRNLWLRLEKAETTILAGLIEASHHNDERPVYARIHARATLALPVVKELTGCAGIAPVE